MILFSMINTYCTIWEADTYACWNGIGFNQKGKWKAGLYKYSLRVGTGSVTKEHLRFISGI